MKQYFIDRVLPAIIIAVILGIGGLAVRGFNPKLIIHLLGGLADGDTVYIKQHDSEQFMAREAQGNDSVQVGPKWDRRPHNTWVLVSARQ